MRKNAEELIRKTVEKGTAAVAALTADSQSPFTYIAEEISEVMNELSATPPEEITICRLKDALLCLNIAAFAADTDGLRNPPYKAVFHYISETKDQLGITIEFFTNLSCDLSQESNEQSSIDLRQWGNILLFYLKGEIQKLGTHLNEQQRNALDAVCKTECDNTTHRRPIKRGHRQTQRGYPQSICCRNGRIRSPRCIWGTAEVYCRRNKRNGVALTGSKVRKISYR